MKTIDPDLKRATSGKAKPPASCLPSWMLLNGSGPYLPCLLLISWPEACFLYPWFCQGRLEDRETGRAAVEAFSYQHCQQLHPIGALLVHRGRTKTNRVYSLRSARWYPLPNGLPGDNQNQRDDSYGPRSTLPPPTGSRESYSFFILEILFQMINY